MTATTTDSASTWPQHFNLLHCSNNYKNRYGTFVRFLPHKHSHFPGKPAWDTDSQFPIILIPSILTAQAKPLCTHRVLQSVSCPLTITALTCWLTINTKNQCGSSVNVNAYKLFPISVLDRIIISKPEFNQLISVLLQPSFFHAVQHTTFQFHVLSDQEDVYLDLSLCTLKQYNKSLYSIVLIHCIKTGLKGSFLTNMMTNLISNMLVLFTFQKT